MLLWLTKTPKNLINDKLKPQNFTHTIMCEPLGGKKIIKQLENMLLLMYESIVCLTMHFFL